MIAEDALITCRCLPADQPWDTTGVCRTHRHRHISGYCCYLFRPQHSSYYKACRRPVG
ncbi:hypothetical protein BDDG_01296 [Blastomyces dermatitidis ATCC 18188]|uniref:Uncharacterized protein n=1 Tax=Ajellomyces dermatitidis (strain ATCC 18188 / CBS 674.68) TaxID=653446 RepID=F2T5D4_AJEDA|nr:hypothetical protein BDDG_01296 [Blastomyces dermatitidis ATCC 18188]